MASAVSFLITVATSSGFSEIAAKLEAIKSELDDEFLRPQRKSRRNKPKTGSDDRR